MRPRNTDYLLKIAERRDLEETVRARVRDLLTKCDEYGRRGSIRGLAARCGHKQATLYAVMAGRRIRDHNLLRLADALRALSQASDELTEATVTAKPQQISPAGAYRLLCAVFQASPTEEGIQVWNQYFGPFENETVANILADLGHKQSTVLADRFGLADGRIKTLQEIGDQMKLTRERIRQIENEALRKLRHPAPMSILMSIFVKGNGVVL